MTLGQSYAPPSINYSCCWGNWGPEGGTVWAELWAWWAWELKFLTSTQKSTLLWAWETSEKLSPRSAHRAEKRPSRSSHPGCPNQSCVRTIKFLAGPHPSRVWFNRSVVGNTDSEQSPSGWIRYGASLGTTVLTQSSCFTEEETEAGKGSNLLIATQNHYVGITLRPELQKIGTISDHGLPDRERGEGKGLRVRGCLGS